MRHLPQRLRHISDAKWLPWVCISLGVILRLRQYLFNRALWIDEAFIALNIVNKSFNELLQPLEYNQGAPIGFLFIEKILVNLLGNSEYILRLYPLFCGIISIFLFYKIVKHYNNSKAVLIALVLFAISKNLIAHSSQVKQYSSDVFISLLLYVFLIYVESDRLTLWRSFLLGIIGAIAIWFSHAAVFILAGMGSSILLFYLIRRDRSCIFNFSVVFLMWILSFSTLYFVNLNNLGQNPVLLGFWKDGFAPFPPVRISQLKWYIDKFFEVFQNPVGLHLSGIAAFMFIIGLISFFKNKRNVFFPLILPIAFLLLASILHRYPLKGRLLLFIIPIVIILIAQGAEEIRAKVNNSYSVIWLTIMAMLFLHPVYYAAFYLKNPSKGEEIRPVMEYVQEGYQRGDILYVYHRASPAFKYYSEKYGFQKGDYIVGVWPGANWKNYIEDLNRLYGNNRVWIIFSHVDKGGDVDDEEFFLYHLDSIGTRLDYFGAHNAAVYLYDLRKSVMELTVLLSASPA